MRPFDPRDVHGANLTKPALHTTGAKASLAERAETMSARLPAASDLAGDDTATETIDANATVKGDTPTETVEGVSATETIEGA